MKTVKLEALSKEAFAPFGEYYTMSAPEGYPLCGELHRFYPDRLTTATSGLLAFSPILVKKPEVMKVTQIEYHTTTAEIILPLNDDMILHVAPPSAGKPLPEYTRAFLVPKNTLIKMMPCVWHLAPLPANADELCAMIVLPSCTYMNDCTVVDLKEDEQFIIEK
ncbi:MAG: ureidoglycolate lyase [Clostridia bacterium]|nr:ureidoglycolate lyase [Clostridia bacterium]